MYKIQSINIFALVINNLQKIYTHFTYLYTMLNHKLIH